MKKLHVMKQVLKRTRVERPLLCFLVFFLVIAAVLWLVEPGNYIGAGEQHIAKILEKSGLPVILVINKIDLAPYVGAELGVMDRDSRKMRGNRPFLFTNIRDRDGVDAVIEWIKKNVLLEVCR